MDAINAIRAAALACMSGEGHGELRLMFDIASNGVPIEVGTQSRSSVAELVSDEALDCVEEVLCGAALDPFTLEHLAFWYPLGY